MKLRVPAVLAVTVLGGAAAIAVTAASCSSNNAPADAPSCELFCIQRSNDAGLTCPEPVQCADAGAACPPGCQPIG